MSTFLHSCVFAATLVFVGCASKPAGEPRAPLEHTFWRLTEMNGKPVAATPGFMMPSLQLNAGMQQASGTSGINRYTALYVLSGSSLRFGSVTGTRMAGPTQAMQLEGAFVNSISQVSSWSIEGNQLDLKASEATVLRFQAR